MMRQYLAWAIFLVLQNAAFTFVSRARNSASYMLHAAAALASNGVWIAAQFISLGIIIDAIKSGSWSQRIGVGLFYTTFTMIGSVLMHWIGKNFIEPRNPKWKVGA